MAKNFVGVEILTDFTNVEQALGLLTAVSEINTNVAYADTIIDQAYEAANEEFNRLAIALAATGKINYMFEWGTLGINKKRTNLRPQPDSERARLWKNIITGEGWKRKLTFVFKQSHAFVPKPTQEDTGMSGESIAALREHIFYNKAMVFETGAAVTIAPKNAQHLIMPFYRGVVPSSASKTDIRRGYTVYKGVVTLVPGAKVAGNFSEFWTRYWYSAGTKAAMTEHLRESIMRDIYMPNWRTFNMYGKNLSLKPVKSLPPVAGEARKFAAEINEAAVIHAKSRERRNG